MITIIAGSRSIKDMKILKEAIRKSGFHIHVVLSGGARGVDQLGEGYAAANGLTCKVFLANWSREGKQAGIVRNIKMAEYGEALIALWDGVSPGTKHMIATARAAGLKVYVHEVPVTPRRGAQQGLF